MRGLEGMWHLNQPNFEFGEKTPPTVLFRRSIQSLGRRNEIFNRISSLHLSPEVRGLKKSVKEATANAADFDKPALQLFNSNLLYMPNQIFLRASPFHCDSWVRDTMIGMLDLNIPDVELYLLSKSKSPLTHPQLPTTRLFPGNRVWAFDDESTMIGVIERAKLSRQGATLSQKELSEWKERWEWVKKHVQDGLYISPSGTERTWLDTYRFLKPDVIAYVQGIFAAAAIAADKLSLDKDPKTIQTAIEGYHSLQHPSGRLQFSKNIPYKDLSSLLGEFLSLAIFEESILPDEIAKKTFDYHPKTQFGYPVVVREDDSYFSEEELNRHYEEGEYHRGGEWPVITAAARAVAQAHGVPNDFIFWHNLLTSLKQSHHAEYIYTREREGLQYNPKMVNHLWNAAAYKAAKMVLDDGQLKELTTLGKQDETRNILTSEAADMPNTTL